MSSCSAVIIENRLDVAEIMSQHAMFLPKDWALVHLSLPVYCMQQYNELLVSRGFWEAMTDTVLIFQHDSLLLRTGIEDFLEWDFCGAPIKWMPGIMNGGLSIRKRDAMLRVIDRVEYRGENEDCYFCDGLRMIGGNLPSVEQAMKFAVETIYHETPIGIHACDKYLTKEQCQKIINCKS